MVDPKMLYRFKRLVKRSDELKAKKTELPKHIAISMHGNIIWAEKNKTTKEEAYRKGFEIISRVIELQVSSNIPIITLNLLSEEMKDSENFPVFTEVIIDFFKNLKVNEILRNNQIKISVLGKWYDLPGRLVEPIKEVLEETKDYDRFFLNFCINYSGNEEIVDSCKIIARRIKAERIDIDAIDKELVKENAYSSYFLPPDLFIICYRKELSGLLLWDSAHSKIFFSDKLWPEFDKAEFMKGIDFFKKYS